MNYTNRQVAESFANMVNGTQTGSAKSANGNFRAEIDSFGNVSLYSYSTKIAYYEKATQTLIFNRTRYSTTTSTKHQTHFYLIERLVYGSKVVSISCVDNVCRWNPFPLNEYVIDNRYIAQEQSWDNKPIFRVFDTVGKSIIKTYKIKRYAVQYADKLNEAQEAKRNY